MKLADIKSSKSVVICDRSALFGFTNLLVPQPCG